MAIPWQTIDSIETGEGRLELRQRGASDFLITIDNRILMNASGNLSEMELARLACAPIASRPTPRVMVGGLGMGFTLRAALDTLPAKAEVVVVELNPVVINWCQGPMAHLTGNAVDDPRVTMVVDDVSERICRAATTGGKALFDAIILDLYEGPHPADGGRNDHLYGHGALSLAHAALKGNGVLAVWAEDPDKGFEKRLQSAGFSADRHRPGKGGRHVVYLAKKTSAGRRPRRRK